MEFDTVRVGHGDPAEITAQMTAHAADGWRLEQLLALATGDVLLLFGRDKAAEPDAEQPAAGAA